MTVNPRKIIQRRVQESDADYAARDINFKVDANYDPKNIY